MLKAMSLHSSLNHGGKSYRHGLMIIFMLLSINTMAKTSSQYTLPDTIQPLILTVANITAPSGNNKFYEITFYQSARFYKLMLANKNCKQSLVLLKQSKKANKPVLVILTEKYGDVIDQVKVKSE